MAIDTPARIAIIGGGPVGLEAALYARFLGYDVDIYERGRACEHLMALGHVRLFTPWRMNVSPLGVAALRAQDTDWSAAEDDALLTCRELVDRYFLPLAQSDLVIDGLHEGCEVVAVGKEDSLKGDLHGDEARGDEMFRLLVRSADGQERIAAADVVLDASGVLGWPRWLGRGGVPAVGEVALGAAIERRLCDLRRGDRARFIGRHTLLVGSGHSAAEAAVALAELATRDAATHITWITRREPSAAAPGPVAKIAGDPLPARDELADKANALAAAGGAVTHWPATAVESIARVENDRLRVELAGAHAGAIEVDRVLALVGYQPCAASHSELQVALCAVTGAPAALGAALVACRDAAVTTRAWPARETLLTTEPNYYVVGAKSFGRDPRFTIHAAHWQIRDLFAIIGDRAELDLYRTIGATPLG